MIYSFFDGRALCLIYEAISRTLAEFRLLFISESSFVSQKHNFLGLFGLDKANYCGKYIYQNKNKKMLIAMNTQSTN